MPHGSNPIRSACKRPPRTQRKSERRHISPRPAQRRLHNPVFKGRARRFVLSEGNAHDPSRKARATLRKGLPRYLRASRSDCPSLFQERQSLFGRRGSALTKKFASKCNHAESLHNSHYQSVRNLLDSFSGSLQKRRSRFKTQRPLHLRISNFIYETCTPN
jgi:hypothetical protein